MIVPSATYRLQFRNGMTFDRAAALAPYLSRLGISHVFGSPIFRAEPGSTHGYDVVDNRVIDEALGGPEAFARMITAFQAEGLGFILDFVPNHMSASPYNPFWRDVLEWGQASDCAQFFDIDWTAAKLLVPALGTSYGQALEAGEFGLHFDDRDGGLTFTYYRLKLPLTPTSYAQVLARAEGDDFAEWARRFAVATPETSSELKAELATATHDPRVRQALGQALASVRNDIEALHELHEQQVWRLTHWRAARETLTYRRFFEIADLVGLKVESPRVFDEIHASVGKLIVAGSVNGLRLDHIDGLADPKAYLERLQRTFGEPEPLYLIVEKILGPEEDLRSDWPVAGTTGYEFITALAGLLVDPRGEAGMTSAYDAFLNENIDYTALVVDAKRRTLTRNLAGELERLKDMAGALAVRHLATRDLGTDTLRRAIIELLAALPVYRTYVDVTGAQSEDRDIIDTALERAKATREVEDEQAIDFLGRVLKLDFESPEDQALALELATRLQQTSGPVMAKAVEDTAFYRYNRLIALNEVGGEPDRFGAPLAAFHAAMTRRLRRQAAALSATSTHDTKRGEDARARLYALSEMPDLWSSAVRRWADLNARYRRDVDGVTTPEPEVEWMFYQALAGAFPVDLSLGDKAAFCELSERMVGFMLKAVREAKAHTTWTGQNTAYEEAVEGFTRATLDPTQSHDFLQDFVSTCEPVFRSGALNSLSQTAIKLAAPGVPDIYQGSELWDLSLVDPDNRRLLDFERLDSSLTTLGTTDLEALIAAWRNGAIKMFVLQAGLELRKRAPRLFAEGDYLPLTVSGTAADHLLAFARVQGEDAVIVLAPRFPLGLLRRRGSPMPAAAHWADTSVNLPLRLEGAHFRNVFTDETFAAGASLPVHEVLRRFPVAMLSRLT
jgi:(1->4)-alpha-D-glucan 1-alpha-D-glucosylmutase